MTHMKTLLAGAIAVTLSQSALAEKAPEGLYSMDALIGADVFLATDREREVGEIEDVLIAEDMKVHGLVLDLDDDLEGVSDDYSRFVGVQRFSVEAVAGDELDQVSYSVFLNEDLDRVDEYPRVDNDWWAESKEAAANLWAKTKSGASSAWKATKEKTQEVLEDLQQTLE